VVSCVRSFELAVGAVVGIGRGGRAEGEGGTMRAGGVPAWGGWGFKWAGDIWMTDFVSPIQRCECVYGGPKQEAIC